MATKKIDFVIQLQVENGVVKAGQLEKALKKVKNQVDQVNASSQGMGRALAQGGSNAGLAGAAITEMGRSISDVNYGMTAVANNLNQLSTLLITLVAKTGGVRLAFKALWAEIMGPLGLILAFQTLITILESKSLEEKKATDSAEDHRKEIEKQIDAVRELNEVSKYHVENTKDIVRLEQDLADTKLYDPTNWQKIADIRTKIIDKQLLLLKAEKASVGDLLSGQELLKLNTQIYELERKRARVYDEEYKKRKKAKDEGLSIDGLWTDEMEANMKYRLYAFQEREKLREQEETAEEEANERELQRLLAMRDARRKLEDEELASAKILAEQKLMLWEAVGDGMISMGQVIGRETAVGKGIAVAGALINTYAAIAGQLKAFAGVPIPGYAIAQAIATGAFGFAQVRRILDVRVPNSGGGGGANANAEGATVTPQFNVIGATGPNRIAEAVRSEMSKPTKAYVTTKDIRSGQELERNTRSGATL